VDENDAPDAEDFYGMDGPSLFGDEPMPGLDVAEPEDGVPEASGVDDDDEDAPDTDEELLLAAEADDALSEEIEIPKAMPGHEVPELEVPEAPRDQMAEPAAPRPAARPTESVPEPPLALYRRYRPDTFADVIGQEHVTEPLQRALINNRVNHAYLFSGPRGCGKTTSARILARCLNCEQGPTPTPCGECQSCRDLARGGSGSIDVIEIDAASHGGVDDARDLRERAFFAPVHSRYKIYIVDEAHMVTPAGFNALLKLVEEPPPHVKFIFATTEPEKVIGTIRSRTHHYPFRLVPPKTLSAYLARLCGDEGVAVEPAVLPLVVRAGAGSVRDSLSVLDQLLGGAGERGVSYGQAAALLGYTPDTLLDEIVDAFAAGDGKGVFATVDKVIEVGQDPRRFAEDLLRRLRDLVIVAAVPDALASGLIAAAGDQADRLANQAASLGLGELTRAAEVMAQGLTDMRGTTAPRLHLELMCARVLLPGADVDDRGIHARLERLERRLAMPTPGLPTEAAAPERQQWDDAPARQAPDAEPTVSLPRPQQAPAPAPQPRDEQPAADPQQFSDRPSRPGPEDGQAPVSRADRPAPLRPPSPRPPAARPAAPEPVPTAAPARPVPTAGATVSVADVRRLWPQVLDEVKSRRRFTWIMLTQNAQVVDVSDGVLTLGLTNAGARDSFTRGGSEDVLRDAMIEVLGADLRITTIVDDGGSPGARPTRAPEPDPEPAPTPPPAPEVNPETLAAVRDNIRPTRLGNGDDTPPPDEAHGADPDTDEALDETGESTSELLASRLGAEMIAEDENEASAP